MVLPLIKLVSLALRQAQRPVSKRLLSYSLQAPWFRRRCQSVGNYANYLTQLLQGRKPSQIVPMAEEQAVANGTEAMTEVVVFTMGSLILYYELQWLASRGVAATKERDEKTNDRVTVLEARIIELEERARLGKLPMPKPKPKPGAPPVEQAIPTTHPIETAQPTAQPPTQTLAVATIPTPKPIPTAAPPAPQPISTTTASTTMAPITDAAKVEQPIEQQKSFYQKVKGVFSG